MIYQVLRPDPIKGFRPRILKGLKKFYNIFLSSYATASVSVK